MGVMEKDIRRMMGEITQRRFGEFAQRTYQRFRQTLLLRKVVGLILVLAGKDIYTDAQQRGNWRI